MTDGGTAVDGPGPWNVAGADVASAAPATGRERVGRVLRERILSGALAPGDRIDLDSVAAECGTSRTPVREACLELAHENLVRVAQRSGVVVIGVTPEAIIENFTVMAALSGVAARWAAERITERQLMQVRELHREVHVAAKMGDDLATVNWMFHREINKACGSPRLEALLADVGRMIPRRFFALFPERVPCSLDEHDELVSALGRGDGETARRVTEEHFAGAAHILSEYVSQIPARSSVGDADSPVQSRKRSR